MKVYVLNDNRNGAGFESEHGFSILIEKDNDKILFDSGETDIFINNAKKLGVDLTTVNHIVLSHGDYDHSNGLKYLNLKTKVCLYAHPSIFDYRISKRRKVYAGINQTKEEIENKYRLTLSKKPIQIISGVYFLGEIERKNPNEINLPMVDELGGDFMHVDDTGLAIKTNEGLIVISGCAHSGICNTIEYAKKVTACDKVYAVLGGFHLKDVSEKLDYAIEYLNDNDCKAVYLAHCTSDHAIEQFKKRLNAETFVLNSGKIIEF